MFFDGVMDRTLLEWMAPLLPSKHFFLAYLASALVIAVGVFAYFSHREARLRPEGIDKGLFGYIFDPDVWLHKSSRQDYVFFAVNTVVYSGIVAHFIVSASVVRGAAESGLIALFGAPETPLFQPSAATAAAYTFVTILAVDFAIFFAHFTMHKIAALWHFHAVHHSAERLTVFTVNRQHPVDLFLTGTLMVVLSQSAFAGFVYLTGAEPTELQVFNINVILFTFFLVGYNLRHSHIWLSYPPWLSYILISPAQHQTHHSIAKKHFNRNFGFIFAFWDWLFGTLYVPHGYERLAFGLSEETPNPFPTVRSLYFDPFRLSWGEIRGLVDRRRKRREDGQSDPSAANSARRRG